MSKIYANPPEITTEEQELLDMDSKQRQKEKAARIKKVLPAPFEFEDTGINIKIKEAEVKTINGCDCLDLIIEAKQNGEILNIDNHLRYFNPPVKIPNGTYHRELDETTKEELDISNFEYNPKEAIKQCIIHTLNGQIK